MAKRKQPNQTQYQIKTEPPYGFLTAVPRFGWRQPLSTPPTQMGPKSRQRGAAHIAGIGVTQPPTQFLTEVPKFEWRQPWSVPPKQMGPISRMVGAALIAATGLFAPVFTPPAAAAIDMDWLTPLSDPTPAKRGLAPHQQQVIAFAPQDFAAPVDVDSWFKQFTDPIRIERPIDDRYLGENNWAAGVATMEWFNPLNEPVRQQLRLASANQAAFFAPSTVIAAETITVDKWLDALSEPTRTKLGLNAALQVAYTVDYFPDTSNANAGQWFGSLAEPLRIKASFSALYQTYTTEYYPDTFTQWFNPLSEPTRPDRSLTAPDQSAVPYVATEVVTVDKWFDALSEPVRIKKSLNAALQAALTAEYFPDTFTQWLIPLSEPTRTKRSLNALDQSWVPFVSTETVTVDKWFDPLSEPVRTKFALRAALQPATTYDAKLFPDPANFLEGWSSGLAEPVRQKLGLITALQSTYTSGYFSFEIITVDKWYASLSDPKRFRPALHVSLQQTTTQDTVFIPSPSRYEGWYGALSEPQRQQAGLKAAQQVPYSSSYVNVAVEVITVDKWFSSLSSPTKPKPGDYDHYKGENEFTAIAASMKWFSPLTAPVRQKIGLPANQQQTLAYAVTFASEIVTVDKWFVSYSEPVRFKRGQRPELQQVSSQDPRYIPNPANFIEGWFKSYAEPIRVPARLVTAAQQAFFYGTLRPEVRFDYYTWLTEPVRQKKGTGAHLQRAFTQDPKLFPNPTRFLEGWYNWWSQPVRDLPQLNVALQQSWTGPDRKPVLATITVTMAVTEVNDDVALFAIKVFAGNPPVTAVVSLVEIGHGASLTSIVEEGDNGSGTSIVES